MVDRRDQILTAARALAAERGTGALTVRAVAAQTGIGASTLRYYFPTQRDLYDAVLGGLLDEKVFDLRIHDTTLPPPDRMVECLWQFLPREESAIPSLERWFTQIATLAGPDATDEGRRAWAALVRRGRDRVVSWLQVLADEGAVAEGDLDRHARLLLTVTDGIGLWMVMPESELTTKQVDQVLRDAVAAVLRRG